MLVIGAGPAGSAAALTLARRGMGVVLADRARFPRDKACGDALIPDALAALSGLALDRAVLARAKPLSGVVITAPGGGRVELRGACAAIPRLVLDDVLRRAAVEAGARWLAPARAVGPIEEGTRVVGAVLRAAEEDKRCIHVSARWTILACGAASADVLRAFGVLQRRDPTAMAARAYVRVPAAQAATFAALHISFERRLSPGYGWVFPGPDDRFNIGVGVFRDARRTSAASNLRELMDRFCATYPPARTLLAASLDRTPLVGAPLRTGLTGARLGRPGMLVAGDAAGATYPLTGEGIGKALATGIAAGETVAAALASGEGDRAWHEAYETRLRADFGGRYHAYRLAQAYMAWPVAADYLAWRASGAGFVQRQLEGLFNDATDARALFSPRGFLRALLW